MIGLPMRLPSNLGCVALREPYEASFQPASRDFLKRASQGRQSSSDSSLLRAGPPQASLFY
jgi:hypothetical protein